MGSVNPYGGIPASAQNQTVLVFLKSLSVPIVLFSESPSTLLEEIKRHIQQANPSSPKLLEKTGIGPIKRVFFLDTELSGVALQSEPAPSR